MTDGDPGLGSEGESLHGGDRIRHRELVAREGERGQGACASVWMWLGQGESVLGSDPIFLPQVPPQPAAWPHCSCLCWQPWP